MTIMKYNFAVLCFLLVSSMAFAQRGEAPLKKADMMPYLDGCNKGDKNCTRQKVIEFVQSHIEFPAEVKKSEEGGVAFVNFVVEKNGSLGDFTLFKDPGQGMGKEAIRVLELMNKEKIRFNPGIDDGKKVRVSMMIPVTFNYGDVKAAEKEKARAEAQEKSTAVDGNTIFEIVGEMPRYAGCDTVAAEDVQNCTFNGIVKHVQTTLKYPEEAKKDSADGVSMVTFVVQKNGEIADIKIAKPLCKSCDAEALRVVKAMPNWIPGKQEGQAVNVRMNLPIQFRYAADPMEDEEKDSEEMMEQKKEKEE